MHQASMHKHMSYQLVRPEFRGGEEVQSKNINQSDIIAALQNHGGQEQQAIDDQQIFYYQRKYLKTLRSEVCHVESCALSLK